MRSAPLTMDGQPQATLIGVRASSTNVRRGLAVAEGRAGSPEETDERECEGRSEVADGVVNGRQTGPPGERSPGLPADGLPAAPPRC